jgi:hypothetical protein
VSLATPAEWMPNIDKRVERVESIMRNKPLVAKTSVILDVMQGYEKGHWTAKQVRALLMTYNDQCREILNFTDGGDD